MHKVKLATPEVPVAAEATGRVTVATWGPLITSSSMYRDIQTVRLNIYDVYTILIVCNVL